MLAQQRDLLISTLIELDGLLTSAALRATIHQALESVGVAAISPTGERFNPVLHRAVEVEPTSDVSRHGVVAETTRIGYKDGGRLLREPEVVVYGPEDDAWRGCATTGASE